MTRARQRPSALRARAAQRGAALLVGMIVLTVITLVVTAAFRMSSNNLKTVTNMQFRDEATAAANLAIEQVVGTPFTAAPASDEIEVDINRDSVVDYTVQVAIPTCVQATQVASASSAGGGSSSSISVASPALYSTVWDIQATVNDPLSGSSVVIRQGVRVILTEAEYTAVCT